MPNNDSNRQCVYVPPSRRSIDAWCDAVATEIKGQQDIPVTFDEADGLSDFIAVIAYLGAKYLNAHNFDTPSDVT